MSDDERLVLRYMWEDGEPTARIAKALDYSPMTIRRVAEEMGLAKRPHGGNRGRKATDAQILEMREMRESGATYVEIGDAYGIDQRLAWHYVNESEIGSR